MLSYLPFIQIITSRPWKMGQEFLNGCTQGVTSYIVIRPLTTVAAFFLQLTDVYVISHTWVIFFSI